MMDRVILHCDLNSFYASVELLEHPELCNRPVAVCGDPESRHGIILAKNEPQRPSGRPGGNALIWCSSLPTTGNTGYIPGRSIVSMSDTPIWWSPSPLMRVGWM